MAVIGGGPAGAFFAIHLLRRARATNRRVGVTIFERRLLSDPVAHPEAPLSWHGCNFCAGGISPRLSDMLRELDIVPPEDVIQNRIDSVTIQGFWKNIELEVPAGREMYSVYRGSRPARRVDGQRNFDSFLLDRARAAGAVVINGEVLDVRTAAGKPLLTYRRGGIAQMAADFVVFATGVNTSMENAAGATTTAWVRQLIPEFVPPAVRPALVFELEAKPKVPPSLATTVHFVEYGSKELRLVMCSIVPKRGFVTVVLVGPSIDSRPERGDLRDLVRRFLELPHIRNLVPRGIQLSAACVCRPNMVVGSARHACGERAAVVGDLVTARLYKDGILSAHVTSRVLAETLLDRGVDAKSVREGYEPILQRFRRDNRFASIVFLAHRIFFGSSILSRVLYQAVITERKTTRACDRHLEQLLWRIASGDDAYRRIFFELIHPVTVWTILTGGALITWRNHLTELAFGLRWGDFGRFTTGVAIEKLEAKRAAFARLIAGAHVAVPETLEFERMYTIKIRAPRAAIVAELGRFGESDRAYFRPRWVRIQRIAGEPNTPGCLVQYQVVRPGLNFTLVMEQIVDGHLLVYRVRDGFASGGVLIFEVESLNEEICALSIYVAFNFTRGASWFTQPAWWAFRHLFPAYIHDVIWNHSLCQLRSIAEGQQRPAQYAGISNTVPAQPAPAQ